MFSFALRAFIAGLIATLTFHQVAVSLVGGAVSLPVKAWNMAPNAYGAPSVLALAFWAGIWGIALCAVIRSQRWTPALIWGAALGAVLPSLWSWTVLAALHARPLFAGGNLKSIGFALFVNAVWGVGTVLLFKAMQGGRAPRLAI